MNRFSEWRSITRGPIGVLLGVAVASCVLVGALGAQSADSDPVIGTWQLNVQRSVYSPGPRPPADLILVRQYSTLEGGWMRFTQANHNPEANPNIAIGVFRHDGERHPVFNGVGALGASMTTGGRPSNVTRSYRRIDERTTESTTYNNGVAGIPLVRAISPNGMVMIETNRGTNAQGVAINNVLVYDKLR